MPLSSAIRKLPSSGLSVDNGQPERLGKAAKFGGCGFVKINLVHDAHVSDGLENSGRLNVLIDVQAFHAVAHRAEADAQKFGGLGTVVTGLLQSLLDDAAFHLVEVILYLHGTRIKRWNGAVIERSFARVRVRQYRQKRSRCVQP